MSTKEHFVRSAPPEVASNIGGTPDAVTSGQVKAQVEHLSFYYGKHRALKDINMVFQANRVTAIIGPSGCGKSTLLRCFNRIHDLYPETRYEGKIVLQPSGLNIIGPETDPLEMRMRVSMVFQKPNAFPKSIFENVAFGLRVRPRKDRPEEAQIRSKVLTLLKLVHLEGLQGNRRIVGAGEVPDDRRVERDRLARWRPTVRSQVLPGPVGEAHQGGQSQAGQQESHAVQGSDYQE